MREKPHSNLIEVSYEQIEVDPKEIEMRLSRAFDVLFDEMVRVKELNKCGLITKNVKQDYAVNRK